MPLFDVKTNRCDSPQVFILGAGASKAALPKGDKNGKTVPLMSELVEVVGLNPTLDKYKINFKGINFEELYSDLISSGANQELLNELEKQIYNYFSLLELPDYPTLYDYLVLSLRGKDLIASFNWDPFLVQAHHRNRDVAELPEILFLHGNVSIALCRKHRQKGFLGLHYCPECNALFAENSKLLYPVKEKNYDQDDFIKSEWEGLRHKLSQAYMTTIFGYSAPTTDVAAKSLMLEAWESNPLRKAALISIIDLKDEKELEETWEDFKAWSFSASTKSLTDTSLFRFPRRVCDAQFMANYQQDPWPENKYPEFKTLVEMHDWIKPLALEEKQGVLSSKGAKAA